MHLIFFSPLYAYLIPLAAAIPFVIHLLNRRKRKKIVFSSVRLLEEVVQVSRKKFSLKKWQRILLLLLRALSLALLVAFIADPWLTLRVFPVGGETAALGGGGDDFSPLAVFLFDVSMSRKEISEGVPGARNEGLVFDRDKRIAAKIIESFPGDNWGRLFKGAAVVSYTNKEEPLMSLPLSAQHRSAPVGIIDFLRKISPTDKPTSHLEGLRAAVKIFLKNDENDLPATGATKSKPGVIFWFTDFAAHGFPSQGKGYGAQEDGKSLEKILLPDNVNLVIVAPQPASSSFVEGGGLCLMKNLAIEGVSQHPLEKSGSGGDYFFDALVRSYDFEGPALLSLFESGNKEKKIFDMPVYIKKNQLNRIRCFLPPDSQYTKDNPDGLLRLLVKGDNLKADNSYYFRRRPEAVGFPSDKKGLNVLIVDGNPAPGRLSNVFYLESALKSSALVGSVETISFGEFVSNYNSLKNKFSVYDAVIFSDFWPSEPYVNVSFADSGTSGDLSYTYDKSASPIAYFSRDYLASGSSKVVIFFAGERLLGGSSGDYEINGIKIYPGSVSRKSAVSSEEGVYMNSDDKNAPGRRKLKLSIDSKYFEEVLNISHAEEFDWNVMIDKIPAVSYDGKEYLAIAGLSSDGREEEGIPFILAGRNDGYSQEKSGGNFFFINTTSGRSWSDFCTKPVFAVMMEGLAASGYRRAEKSRDKSYGDIYGFAGVEYKLYDDNHRDTASYHRDKSRLVYYVADGKPLPLFAVPPERAGIYQLNDEGVKYAGQKSTRRNFYFVNIFPEESNPAFFKGKIDDFIKKGKNSNIYFLKYRSNPDESDEKDIASKAAMIAAGRSLRRGIGVAIFLVILIENFIIIAWRRNYR